MTSARVAVNCEPFKPVLKTGSLFFGEKPRQQKFIRSYDLTDNNPTFLCLGFWNLQEFLWNELMVRKKLQLQLRTCLNLLFIGFINYPKMGLSENRETPQIIHFHEVFDIINHPKRGTTIFGNIHILGPIYSKILLQIHMNSWSVLAFFFRFNSFFQRWSHLKLGWMLVIKLQAVSEMWSLILQIMSCWELVKHLIVVGLWGKRWSLLLW